MNKIALIFISILFVALLLGVTVVAIENITNATDNVTEDVIVEGVKIPTEIKKEDAESNIEYVSRKLRTDYWKKKISRNIERDKYTNKKLKNDGWTVIRFWEHQILKNPEKCLRKIISTMQKLQRI